MRSSYDASRGGHAPGHLRDALYNYLDPDDSGWPTPLDSRDPDLDSEMVSVGGDMRPLRWLVGQLWDCADIVPGQFCSELEIPLGSTCARVARRVAALAGTNC